MLYWESSERVRVYVIEGFNSFSIAFFNVQDASGDLTTVRTLRSLEELQATGAISGAEA